jgi:hypothetical protein
MAKRRSNKEGSIYQRPDGRWCAQVSLDGRRLTRYAETQRECREWLKEIQAQIDEGLTIDGARATLGHYLVQWLETAKPSLRPKTWQQYSQIVSQHILPDLGSIRLRDLRGDLPPAFTPIPPQPLTSTSEALSLPAGAWLTAKVLTGTAAIPVPPTPAWSPPDRIAISWLGLDAPVDLVGMPPSSVAPGVVEWEVPDHHAAYWLNTSAPFGLPDNTVLGGHHNIKVEAFRNLWTLQAGDEIVLRETSGHVRRDAVREVPTLPFLGQLLEVRVANARYLLPIDDERLTLITCWPYENNTDRTVVIVFPLSDLEVSHEAS